jgi:hypothetical protein
MPKGKFDDVRVSAKDLPPAAAAVLEDEDEL